MAGDVPVSAYIIAEAGTGHKGTFIWACDFVDAAAEAGADAIKFQIFVPDEPLFCPVEGDDKRIPRWNETALPLRDWRLVKARAEENNIDFLASVFQPTGIEWLKKLQPKYYKVASRAAKTYPYYRVPGPFLISDGFGIPRGDEVLICNAPTTFLQCMAKYPTPLSEARWRRHEGLSDHSGTPWPAIDAIARGAEFIEVHFGDKEGPDGPVNLSQDELGLICKFRDAVGEMRGG
jgi:N-acetylneuraminate synthase